jgi:hypothetical protein
LPQARKEKAEKNKDVGEPIELRGVPIGFQVDGDFAWTAESGHVVRKLDLRVAFKAFST